MYSERKNTQNVDFLLQQGYLKFSCSNTVLCVSFVLSSTSIRQTQNQTWQLLLICAIPLPGGSSMTYNSKG